MYFQSPVLLSDDTAQGQAGSEEHFNDAQRGYETPTSPMSQETRGGSEPVSPPLMSAQPVRKENARYITIYDL